MSEKHIHDCTGPDARCPCGYVFQVPPVFVSISVKDGRDTLVDTCFHCSSVGTAIAALCEAIDVLEARRQIVEAV